MVVDWWTESCVGRGPTASAIPASSHVVTKWFDVDLSTIPADVGRCSLAGGRREVGCCEWRGALPGVRQVVMRGCSSLWLRSCSSLGAEVLTVFIRLQVHLPQTLRGSAAGCWYCWIFTSTPPSLPSSSSCGHPSEPTVPDSRRSAWTMACHDYAHQYFCWAYWSTYTLLTSRW